MKHFFSALTFALVLLVATSSPVLAESKGEGVEGPQRIILVIADGMGFPYLTAYRHFKDGRNYTHDSDVERTWFDRHFVGMASTYPADETQVTDSAASATALATGYKTFNGAISVDAEHNPIRTVMQYAKDNDWRTGTVVTTRVTHATPAAFFAHVPSRRMEADIADQMSALRDDGTANFDVVLGSGTRFFVRTEEDGTEVNHIRTLQDAGVRFVESYEQLQAQQRLPLLGLFHDDAFPYVIDDKKRLRMMSEEALRLLDNEDRPYIIMIEAAMIDWCGHANDIACAMHEMAELEELMEFLYDYASDRTDTAVILTADHSTGGLTLGADGDYKWMAAEVHKIGRGLRTMASDLVDMPAVDWDEYIEKYLPFPLTMDQQSALRDHSSRSDRSRSAIQQVLVDIVRFHTGTGWTTGGHTGEDVPVITFGPWADYFRGFQDQTDIGRQLIEWVK
ncbi:alkaline phosphatase [Aliidiomarina halalkaliphila]|uniref:Alkaline phosphatase n=1 Tax=Aliidiomarina halalkaliphila TaxID=2593535 RepID=A0A552X5J4_9GAMM|nr:alkaline phosphatase [Aliidiomarina halalkaliphila]TRW50297.1 alkaline phosphatase [Aliidiomarina halalkaliphila]